MCGGCTEQTQITSWSDDTIVAIATPPGEGGVAIVRLSGPLSPYILQKTFLRSRPHGPWQSHHLYYGILVSPDSKQKLDEALAVLMKAPHSYTKEDVVEFHIHGGNFLAKFIVQQCIKLGARLAQPGEFTLRAFLNGRIDLAQAESVLALIKAKNSITLQMALEGLQGKLSRKIDAIRNQLLDIMSRLEAELDFGHELPEIPRSEIAPTILSLQKEIKTLIDGAHTGVLLSEGIPTAIIGPPNAGKSTLFNVLLDEQRALVTPYPGTTRDRLEKDVYVEGILLHLIDTAGIRKTPNPIEELGIQLAWKALEQAELVILVLDISQKLPDEYLTIHNRCRHKNLIVVLNKQDLLSQAQSEDVLPTVSKQFPHATIITTSLLTGYGVKDLKASLGEASRQIIGEKTECFSLNERHLECLIEADQALELVLESCKSQLSAEFISLDLRRAIKALGSIQGIDVEEEVLNRIFASFCLGK